MILSIENTEYIDDYFIEWLIDLIRKNLIFKLDFKKIKTASDKLGFNVINALILFVNNLTYHKTKNVYIIELKNRDILLPGYDIKLNAACKLINYGNNEFKGYPILTQIFNDIRKNIIEYYEEYLYE